MISFVIPAHNEASAIGATIAALHTAGHASGRAYEVVVADDASTDQTAAVARGAGATVVSINRRHIAAVRNEGARAAHGDLLFFVDADTIVPPACVQQALTLLDAGVVGVGAAVKFDGKVPFYASVMLAVMQVIFRVCKYTGGCFLCCRRADFDAAGGWDEHYFAGEEIHMAKALKRRGKFRLVKEPVITSGRKLRTYSAREVFGQLARLFMRPWRLRRREGLEMWYGPRREDRA